MVISVLETEESGDEEPLSEAELASADSYHPTAAPRYVGSELFLIPNINSCLHTNHRFMVITQQGKGFNILGMLN